MKTSLKEFRRIVQEEVLRQFSHLREAEDDGVATVDAQHDNKKKEKEKGGDKKHNKELPTPPEESDQDLEQNVDTPENDLAKDANGQGIGDMIKGKTILSFTVEPNPTSAQTELVLQFEKDPAPLRIMISPSGNIRYAYKGQMSKDLGGGVV